MSKITPERIEEIEAAEKAATDLVVDLLEAMPAHADGEFFRENEQVNPVNIIQMFHEGVSELRGILARTATPDLLAEREEREKVIEWLEGVVREYDIDVSGTRDQLLHNATMKAREAEALAEKRETERDALKEQLEEQEWEIRQMKEDRDSLQLWTEENCTCGGDGPVCLACQAYYMAGLDRAAFTAVDSPCIPGLRQQRDALKEQIEKVREWLRACSGPDGDRFLIDASTGDKLRAILEEKVGG